MKSMNKTEMVKRDEALCLWEEREIMALSNSDWLVRMYYSFQDPINIYMVMEFVQGGDMVNFMSTYDVDEDTCKFYLAEVSLGLDFLHSLGFIHRDMKPDNMLIDGKGHLKICDFGTCIRMDENGKVKSSIAVGTPDYISPEVLNSQNNNTPYGKECDWWSVGIFVYEFLLGDTPFYSKSLIGTYSKILNYKKSLEFPDDVDTSPEAVAIIKRFLTETVNRLGMKGIDEIKSQPFFKGVKWSWDNIREYTPPIVPDLSGEADASCFEGNQNDDLIMPLPQSSQLACDHFPFVGFSYSGDYIFNDKLPITTPVATATIVTPTITSPEKKSDTKINAGVVTAAAAISDGKLNELKKLLAEKESMSLQLAKNIEVKDELLKSAQEKFSAVEKARILFEAENVNLKTRIKTLETELQSYAQDIKKLEVNIKFTKIAELEARRRHEELLDQASPLKEAIEASRAAKLDLETRLDSTVKELAEARSSLETLEKNYAATNNNFKNLRNEVDKMKMAFKCDNIAELHAVIEKTQNVNKEIVSKLQTCENEIRNYEEILKNQSTHQANNIETDFKIKNLYDEKIVLQATFNKLEAELQNLNTKNTELTQNLRGSIEEKGTLTEKIKDLTGKLLMYNQNESSLLRERNDLIVAKGDLETRLEKSMNFIRNLEKRIIIFDEQFSYFELKMAVQTKKIDDMESTIKAREIATMELNNKISQLMEINNASKLTIDTKNKEIMEVNTKITQLEAELSVLAIDADTKGAAITFIPGSVEELQFLRQEFAESRRIAAENQKKFDKTLETERLLKEESIKKLNQIITMPQFQKMGTIKQKPTQVNRSDRKVDQLYKQLQMDYFKLRDSTTETAKSYELKISDLNTIIMDLQANIENLKREKTNYETVSAKSNYDPLTEIVAFGDPKDLGNLGINQIIKQSFLFYPSKSGKSSRKISWTRCVVTLTNATLTIYKDSEISDTNIMHKIQIGLLYYVRPICQNDLIRSIPSDIPKIFQVIYNDDTDASEAFVSEITNDKCTVIANHCLVNIQYHMPATCDVCGKGLWGFIKSSYAMECKNCHFKCHREHANEPKAIPLCRDYENRRMAKEILLMACSSAEQKSWIDLLLGLMKLTQPVNKRGSVFTPKNKGSLGADGSGGRALLLELPEK